MPVRDRRGKLPKAERAGLGRVGTAGDESGGVGRGRARGVTIAGPTTARMRFKGLKFVRRIRKPWEGERPAGGRRQREKEGRTEENLEVSVGLVRRQETPRRLKGRRETGIGGISRTVAVGRGRRARWRHTEVRSSYHFRV
ncbi:hypothetical protein PPACK8108_LOCUS15256 [Phakopsora pachyrhizi]|uniref:Uncharacterized protein n=1 Tax=Phakopsora pachyrhizi TaxID=170000 RepID=A0AAV0B7J2_PHAPC|nr:hypothetical protein PPACK8108_LOCUS15256 [Phakopsora pachyrhizi]